MTLATSPAGKLLNWTGLRPGSWIAYLTAALIVAVALAVRLALAPWIVGAQFITFFPAIIVTTFACGTAAGLLAVALSAAAAWFIMGAEGVTPQEFNALLLFALVAGLDVAIISALRMANTALRTALAQVERLNTELGASATTFRDLLESAPDAMVIVDRKGRISLINAETERLFGFERQDLLGRPIEQLMPEQHREQHRIHFAEFQANPRARPMGEGRDLFGQRPDGGAFPVEVGLSPLHADRDGGVIAVIRDISERKAAEARQSLLLHELNHRVKNTLAIVQSVANQTLNATNDPAAFRKAFSGRLMAISKSHDLLTRNDWTGADVREIIAEQLGPYQHAAADRFDLSGPTVRVGAKIAMALGMMLGELATNAAKYGALSVDAGRVGVSWQLKADAGGKMLQLTWREIGGPAVAQPSRRGFGSRLIERGLSHELGGSARMTFNPAGLVCELEFPIDGENPAATLASFSPQAAE